MDPQFNDSIQFNADPTSTNTHSQVIFLVCGTLRVSKITRFLSDPVITGFTTGAALFIGFAQLRLCFGIQVRTLSRTLTDVRHNPQL